MKAMIPDGPVAILYSILVLSVSQVWNIISRVFVRSGLVFHITNSAAQNLDVQKLYKFTFEVSLLRDTNSNKNVKKR